ncbi:MAG: Tim10/DDP family zinc finger-domain-containing protein [Piptocephalis tieghemiana]|nr:MAG: Tim10/DDP family zinc finger-domain-containing protein [Piptocephalis tieghemiana]
MVPLYDGSVAALAGSKWWIRLSAGRVDASNLTASDQAELRSFLEGESQKARVQEAIHTFTEMCTEKCLPGKPGTKLSSGEEACLVNCVGRFLDTSMFIMKKLNGKA